METARDARGASEASGGKMDVARETNGGGRGRGEIDGDDDGDDGRDDDAGEARDRFQSAVVARADADAARGDGGDAASDARSDAGDADGRRRRRARAGGRTRRVASGTAV